MADRVRATRATPADVVVVGAGFAGLYALHLLRKQGLDCVVLEAGADVGGTWYWNRYPGARCDIESVAYSYSFDNDLQQEWSWPHRFSYQPEILEYARAVADRFDLRRDICFDTRVARARFDPDERRWTLETTSGEKFITRFCVMATGCLSVPKLPEVDGLHTFKGELIHTADWPPNGVDFSGRRVGVIGTGSSGIQSIPIIARQADHLTVFQRTPNYNVPAWNRPLAPSELQDVRKRYPELRRRARNSIAGDFPEEAVVTLSKLPPEAREAELETRWRQGGFNIQYAFTDIFSNPVANEAAAEFTRRKIREAVHDPATAAALCPSDHPFGTKRLCVEDGYYETFNRENVSLVDLRQDPIRRFVADGVQTQSAHIELDALVLATGFDAMTGALTKIDIRGSEGRSLAEKWRTGANTYLGVSVAEFPNLFVVTGPGSPSVLCNMVLAIEQNVEWIGDCIAYVNAAGIEHVEVLPEAEAAWVAHVNAEADKTLFPKANSWYMGANVPGKARVFMPYVGGFKAYSDACTAEAEAGYPGFRMH